jgi:hypothetical protein
LDAIIDELIEISDPVLVAIEVATKSGSQGLLMRSIDRRAKALTEAADQRPEATIPERPLAHSCLPDGEDVDTLIPQGQVTVRI